MVRVLLLLEDYNELLFTETILKKVGFDVESAKNHLNLVEILLGFNPEVLVVPGNGRRIHLSEVLQQVRKQRRQPDIFVIGENELVLQDGAIAKVLTHPLNPKELLTSLAEYGGLDADSLLDKYKRAQAEVRETVHMQSSAAIESASIAAATKAAVPAAADPAARSMDIGQVPLDDSEDDKKELRIHLQPTTVSPAQREERFKKALTEVNTKSAQIFDKNRIKNEKKSLRINEHLDERSHKLENERKEFLKTLTEAKPISSSKKTN